MCGVITKIGSEVHDFKVGDKVIVCAVMPVWRSLEAQDGLGKQHQDNMYGGVDFPDRGGSFVDDTHGAAYRSGACSAGKTHYAPLPRHGAYN